jgi:hypothetical protein
MALINTQVLRFRVKQQICASVANDPVRASSIGFVEIPDGFIRGVELVFKHAKKSEAGLRT